MPVIFRVEATFDHRLHLKSNNLRSFMAVVEVLNLIQTLRAFLTMMEWLSMPL